MSHRTKTCVLAALGTALVLSSCGGSDDGASSANDSPPPSEQDSTTLVVGAHQEPPTYDYTESPFGVIPQLLMLNVLEPLLDKTEDGSLEPLLAESYEISEDGREYLFTLREATFHDGSDVTADDVVYSLQLYQDAVNETLAAPLEKVDSIEVVDEHNVRVTLSEPSQRFLEAMYGITGMIIPEGSEEQLASDPVGTGPFMFTEWRNGIDVSLARYDDYWGDMPYFENVAWRFIPDQAARTNAFLAGETDLARLGRQQIEEMAGTVPGDVEVAQTGGQIILFLFLNADDERFDDERVRQAIAHAVDRDEIVTAVNPEWSTTCAFVNPLNVPWGTDYCPYPHDPDQAQGLLDEAGAADLEVEFKYVNEGHEKTVAEVIAAQLEATGITVERRPLDAPTMVEQTQSGDFELGYIGGSEQIDAFMCPPWFGGDCVPEFDEMLTKADRSLDRDEWAHLRRQAVEFHADRAYVIPLFVASTEEATRGLTGVKPYRSYNELDLRNLRWEEE